VGETGISVGSSRCDETTTTGRAGLFRAEQAALFDDGVAAQLFWVLDITVGDPARCTTSITMTDPSFALLRPA
jgi:hypothetical protein